MNSWNFTGNLGGDAESKFLPNGDAIVNFSVAVKAGYGEKAVTTWVRCSMFGKRGEAVAPYLIKGAMVGVVGEVQLRPWTDKTGVEKSSLEVRVADLTLLGAKDKPARGEEPPSSRPGSKRAEFDDEIPPF